MISFRTFHYLRGWKWALYWPGQVYPRVSRDEYPTQEQAADEAFCLMLVLAAYPGFTSNDLAQEAAAAEQFFKDRLYG